MLTAIFCVMMMAMVFKCAWCVFKFLWKAFFWVLGGIIAAAAFCFCGWMILGIIAMVATLIVGCVKSAAD